MTLTQTDINTLVSQTNQNHSGQSDWPNTVWSFRLAQHNLLVQTGLNQSGQTVWSFRLAQNSLDNIQTDPKQSGHVDWPKTVWSFRLTQNSLVIQNVPKQSGHSDWPNKIWSIILSKRVVCLIINYSIRQIDLSPSAPLSWTAAMCMCGKLMSHWCSIWGTQ